MNEFMKIAVEEALQGIKNGDGGPFGAVIVKNGEVIASAHNEVLKNQDATCHGEIMAIRIASQKLSTFDLSGCELYTTGEPCPMCLGAIMWANIDKVYYGCNVDDTAIIGFRDDDFYKKISSVHENGFLKELDRDSCIKLYNEYANIKNKKNY